MEYEKIDEATRREACEKVKKIAEAIKKIRKKYYLCFDKISDADKQRYDELKVRMQNIADANGLEKFNAQLIKEIDTQYSDIPKANGENGMLSNDEDMYKRYLTAVGMQGDITVLIEKVFGTDDKLIETYSRKGQQVQNYIEELLSSLKERYGETILRNEKMKVFREKFGKQKAKDFYRLLGSHYQETNKNQLEREEISDEISELDKTLDKVVEVEQPTR